MTDSKPLKVLVSAPLGVGGLTTMMINIQSHLDRKKINFDYLVFHDRKEPMEDTVYAMGSHKIIAAVDDLPIGFMRRICRVNEIRKVCKKNKIQILHYNADSPADLTNVIGARLGGVKYITFHSHNAGFGTAGKSIRILSAFLKPFTSLLCDNFLGCSELAARFLFPKSIINSGKYSVLPNGIELNKYDFNPTVRDEIRKKLDLEGKYVVGHAGRFSDQKNHSFLLDIFQKIYEKDKNTILLLFGAGELLELIKKKDARLGIEDAVIFYGTSNEMEKMWQAMDVFVMPSLHEGLPVTGIEAQASGLPCIFADTITREVDVTGKSEFLSLKESPAVWADHVLKHKTDTRESGVPALKKAHYDIQQTADMISELYLKVADRLEGDLTK